MYGVSKAIRDDKYKLPLSGKYTLIFGVTAGVYFSNINVAMYLNP